MTLREGLTFERLSPREQHAYGILLKAFSLQQTTIDITDISADVELMKIVQAVLCDNPPVFYFDSINIRTVTSSKNRKLELTRIFSNSQLEKMNAELEKKVNKILSSVKLPSNDAYSQLIYLYEYLQSNVQYDKKELEANAKGKGYNPISHIAYGALITKRAVCDGISFAFSLLAGKLGFKSMQASGYSQHGIAPEIEPSWNIIKVNNRYYHMDVTWDTNAYSQHDVFSYDYFALDDDEISNDHDWDINATPACSFNDLSYFHRNGLFANNMNQLNDIIRNSCANNRIFRVKLSYNIKLPENVEEFIAQKFLDELIKYKKQAEISFNWNKHTRCFFAKLV